MMARLDGTYRELKEKSTDSKLSAEESAKAKSDLAIREKVLLPLYTQVANQFADAHDKAGRALAKGCIRATLEWESSRRYFYARLRRRLAEERALSSLAKADPTLSRADRLQSLNELISADGLDLTNDAAVATALEQGKSDINAAVKALRAGSISSSVASLAGEDAAAVIAGLRDALGSRISAEDVAVRYFPSLLSPFNR
jgi:acetyl-CoA carboxylase/biotin carboxylase 1